MVARSTAVPVGVPDDTLGLEVLDLHPTGARDRQHTLSRVLQRDFRMVQAVGPGEQSVNNRLPDRREQEVMTGTDAKGANNQRTNSCGIPGI
jgi:hypothetical protein